MRGANFSFNNYKNFSFFFFLDVHVTVRIIQGSFEATERNARTKMFDQMICRCTTAQGKYDTHGRIAVKLNAIG